MANWPWAMIGACIAGVVLLVTLWVNLVRPWRHRRALRYPCNAFFNIRELQGGNLNHFVRDDSAHRVKELVLPSNSVVEIEIAYEPTVNFHAVNTVFVIDGDPDCKPVAVERHTRFIAERTGKARWIPSVDESEFIDVEGNYHYRSRAQPRSIGSYYTTGLRLQTKKAGIYKVWLEFLTNDVYGSANDLEIRVEDKPHTRMRCVLHWKCWVRPSSMRG